MAGVRKGRVCKVDWESAMHYNWPKFEYVGDICVSELKPSTTHNTEGKTGSHPHYSGCGPIWLSPQLNNDPNNDAYETCDDHHPTPAVAGVWYYLIPFLCEDPQ
ncbi:hypothetical protein BS47DRAFT_1369385 [Hydnum rufescens UP504]|uniref:Uncharacterized protein n=1 Tax=Hydnum rufescens UP504 TaxID=1448309 RepID=A0A9P6DGZ4_9AGAM|nr:hypothetical protein BS47DRAFT_1369385 [Hydnum rufescens UP504]